MRPWLEIGSAMRWLLRKLMFLWVRVRTLPKELGKLEISDEDAICYVCDVRGVADPLVLDEVCIRAGLPRPTRPMAGTDGELPGIVFLRRMRGVFVRRLDSRRPERLDALYRFAVENSDRQVTLVPVSIFFGRSPDKEDSGFKQLFSEAWSVAGRSRKLFKILVHGRNTLVQFSTPLPLARLIEEDLSVENAQRKLSRILRVHFRRVRVATIGPDLSHRRILVDELLATPAVRREIRNQAQATNSPVEKVRGKARKYANEIAADYSYPVIRFMDGFLSWLWNKLYHGVEVKHFDLLKEAAPGAEVIYVPCHRSHIDYLLLSYILYHRGFAPPHIAAGVNLNLPLVGSLLRRSGAFFLRRSFRGNRLYSRVFDAYLRRNIARGVSIEYFIEGTRSRTGRLLPHKAGLLAMTVQAYLRDQQRPLIFVPIYIGYERLIEGRSYLSELSGKAKSRESIFSLLRSVGVLREDFGRVYVNFGQPLSIEEKLTEAVPDWRERDYPDEGKPDFLREFVDGLGQDILLNVNRATAVNPINLLALALLATPKQAMAEEDLTRQLDLYLALLRRAPYSDLVTLPDMDGRQIVRYGEEFGSLERRTHPLGDIVRLEGDNAVLMTYFRNNVLHLFALPSMIACCFIENRSMSVADIARLCALARPFVEQELIVDMQRDAFEERIQVIVDVLADLELLIREEGDVLRRPESGTFSAVQLSVLAQSVLQNLERYYLVIALLMKHGSGAVPQADLENECKLVAERISMLHELDAPEFFDRRLFRGFIDQLRQREIVWADEHNCLAYDERIVAVEKDARVVLSEQIRHSILQVTHR